MYWPRTATCGAAFHELFANDWPVVDLEAFDPSWMEQHVDRWDEAAAQALLADPRPHLVLGTYTWLIRPGDRAVPDVGRRCAELIAELQPSPPLAQRIADLRARHFRPTTIGVHLRRGDFLRHRPDVSGNTREAMAAVDRMLVDAPEAGILLCTDDGARDPARKETRLEGVRTKFARRYGERLVSIQPRSLDRGRVEAVQDALVELWLLRATTMLVGTTGSSFSGFAAAARNVPHVMVGRGIPAYRPVAWLSRVTGTGWLLRRLFRVIYGFEKPFPGAGKRLAERLRRLRVDRLRPPRRLP
jgi:hypothetical protein